MVARLETGQQSIQVLAISFGGMREFVFYTRDPAAAKATIEELQAAKIAHEIQGYVAEDAKWEVFKSFA